MTNFNKQAAFIGALLGVLITLIIGLVGFAVNIS